MMTTGAWWGLASCGPWSRNSWLSVEEGVKKHEDEK
jgi:hypothetical protein